jgi:hypothetical protein
MNFVFRMLTAPKIVSITKAWMLFWFCAFLFIFQSVATALSHTMLTENENAAVRKLVIDGCKDQGNLNPEVKFQWIAGLCARYKWALSRLTNELGAMKSDEHPPDLDTLPPAPRAHEKVPHKDETPRLDDLVFLDSLEDLHSLGARHNISRILQTIRSVRVELIWLVGEQGLKTLDAQFAVPARTIAFIKYGRDGNFLSADDVTLLKRVLRQDKTIDSEEKANKAIEILSNYFYNYRTNEVVEPAANNLTKTKELDDISEKLNTRARSSKELEVGEFVRLNLLIDRKYFVSNYGSEGLTQIDDYLGMPSSLRNTLAESPELYKGQLDLLTNQAALKSAVSDVQKAAKTKRPETWTKAVPSEKALAILITEYIDNLHQAARYSQDTYVLYSQQDWPERLEKDLDDNNLPALAESKMNSVLRIKWMLEEFSNSQAVTQLNDKLRFVYNQDSTIRSPYEHMYQKSFNGADQSPPGVH